MAKSGSISISLKSQTASNKTSRAVVNGYISTSGESWRGDHNTGVYNVYQDGVLKKTGSFTSGAPLNSSNHKLFSVEVDITHKSDGTSGIISANYNYDGGWCTGSGSTTLNPFYTISYNANGGSGAPSSQTKVHGTTLKLSSTVPTRKGYTFVGWSTSKDSTKVSYYAGGNYTSNASATLYAVWSAISYKVTYNGNSGTSEVHGEAMSDTATYGQNYSTKANMFEKLGYEFVGWNEKADGTGTDWTDKIGTPFTWNYTSNIVLYAQWEIKANCRVKEDGQHKLGMMYVKNNGKYYPCVVSQKTDGTYKNSTIT